MPRTNSIGSLGNSVQSRFDLNCFYRLFDFFNSNAIALLFNPESFREYREAPNGRVLDTFYKKKAVAFLITGVRLLTI